MTGSIVTEYNDQWNLSISRTDRINNVEGADNSIDYLFQVTVGYIFENGFSVDAGYRQSDLDGDLNRGIVSLIAYSHEF